MNLRDAVRTMSRKHQKAYYQLTTDWGEQLNPNHVLDEYPRPQLKRDNYFTLNGYWSYAITTEKKEPSQYDGMILVPFSPESFLSGVDRQLKPNQYLHYKRMWSIPKIPLGQRCILHFGAVDQFCEVYINDIKVAEHMGGYLPFSVDITFAILRGENLIRLRVKDETDTSYHSCGKQKLKRGGMFYTAQSGIWQSVWMEWVTNYYIEKLKITPLYDLQTIKVEIQMNDIDAKLKSSVEKDEFYHIEIYQDKVKVNELQGSQPFFEVELEDMISWSPENPFLYDIVITAGKDRVESYFAMRKYEITKDEQGIPRIYLNNQSYFQNGLLDQGYWPDGLYTAPSDEALIYDIQMAKNLGFNMLRKHLKIEPLRWYYHCDRLGMIVWQDMVNGGEGYHKYLCTYFPTLLPRLASKISDRHYRLFGRGNEQGRKEWLKECMETVELLYNYPSVAVWVPFNEGWGQFDSLKITKMIRDLDPTRLIDHASGWFDQGGSDFESVHNYFRPLKLKKKQRAEILSEYGGYACSIKGNSYTNYIYGYRIYERQEELNQVIHHLIEEDIMKLKEEGLSAAVYTQLTDIEEEVNGLLTYDRKVCKITKLNVNTQ